MGSKNKIIVPKLPKQFMVFGNQWKIVYAPDLYTSHGAWGLTDFNRQQITINKPTETVPMSEDLVWSTLFHELVHSVLHSLSYFEDNSNEPKVDRLGQTAYQIFKTIK